ncbi:MAG: hypothetical protein ACK5LF_14625, partial [Bacteroides xylanisolvens]
HITIIPFIDNDKSYVKNLIFNVNFFVKKHDNGMIKKNVIDENLYIAEISLKSVLAPTPKLYLKLKPEGGYNKNYLGEAKTGFDCTNIRLEVITELN